MLFQFSNRPLCAPIGPSVLQQGPLLASGAYLVFADHKLMTRCRLIDKFALVRVQRSQFSDEEDYTHSPIRYGIFSVHVQIIFMVRNEIYGTK